MKTQENHNPIKISKIILLIIGIIFSGFLLSVLIFVFFLPDGLNLDIGENYQFVNDHSDSESEQQIVNVFVGPVPFGVDSKYQNALREAESFWEKQKDVVFREVHSQEDADVIVEWVKEFGGKTLGHAVHSNFIEIGLGGSTCYGIWKPYKYETTLNIAIHELGHILGYPDVYENKNSYMYYLLSTKYEIDIDETEVLQDGWTTFYPLCTKNSVGDYYFEVTSDEPLNIYIVPSEADYDLFKEERTFSNYVACTEKETTFYKKRCAVDSGTGIILENPSTFGLGETARYRIKVIES